MAFFISLEQICIMFILMADLLLAELPYAGLHERDPAPGSPVNDRLPGRCHHGSCSCCRLYRHAQPPGQPPGRLPNALSVPVDFNVCGQHALDYHARQLSQAATIVLP